MIPVRPKKGLAGSFGGQNDPGEAEEGAGGIIRRDVKGKPDQISSEAIREWRNDPVERRSRKATLQLYRQVNTQVGCGITYKNTVQTRINDPFVRGGVIAAEGVLAQNNADCGGLTLLEKKLGI